MKQEINKRDKNKNVQLCGNRYRPIISANKSHKI